MKRIYVLLAVMLGVLSLSPHGVLLSASKSPAGLPWGPLAVSTSWEQRLAQTVWAAILRLTSAAGDEARANQGALTVQAAGRGKPYLNLRDGREMRVTYRGDRGLADALQDGSGRARALASADFDRNGTPDLVAGYALNGAGLVTLQRGNPDAFAPTDDSVFVRMQQGYNPESLLPVADVYHLPVSPDFLVTGNFTHDSEKDILFAAKGGALYLMAGDGTGRLGDPQLIDLPGTVTALAAGEFRAADGFTDIAVGVSGPLGDALLIFDAAEGLSNALIQQPLGERVSGIEFGGLDDDPFMDVAVAAGNEILVVHGWGRKEHLETPASRVERFNVGVGLRALAVGEFVWDRDGRSEIAALSDDGTIHIAGNTKLDARPFTGAEAAQRTRGKLEVNRASRVIDVESVRSWQPGKSAGWSEASKFASSLAGVNPNSAKPLLRTNLSYRETHDLLVLGAKQSKLEIVRSLAPNDNAVEPLSAAGDLTRTTLDLESAPVAVLTLPRKLNGVTDVVMLNSSSARPNIVANAPDTTIIVDRTDDPSGAGLTAASACTAAPNDCSLRGALQFANLPQNNNTTIMLPANTYILSINGTSAGGCDGNTVGDLGANRTMSILGAGAATTIIRQTGTGPANDGDRIMCMNEPFTVGLVYNFSGVSFVGGREGSAAGTGTVLGGAGIIGGELNNSLTLTNVVFANNQETVAGSANLGGGGLQITGGDLIITNSTFGGSSAPGAYADRSSTTTANLQTGSGGGIAYTPSSPQHAGGSGTLTITGSTFSRNTAAGIGGGGADLFIFAFASPGGIGSGSATVSTSTFSNNQASNTGGGIVVESLPTTVATTSFTNNSAGNRGGGIYVGGGSLLLNGATPSITFSGNTATNGGSSVSTAAPVNVDGTNTTIGGDIEISTGGTWTNNTGSALSPTNVVVTGGTFNMNNSTMNVSGNLTIGPGAIVGSTFNGNTGTVNIQGNFVLNAGGAPATTLNAGTGTFNFNGTGAQSITNGTSITFFNLTDSNVTQPLTLNNSLAVNGSLNVNGANAILSPVAAAIISGSGTLTGTGTARASRIAAAPDFLSQYTITNKTLTNLTIDYSGAGNQTVNNTPAYSHLRISGSGTKTLQGNTVITGNLNIISGATFASGNFNFALGGSWTNGGAFTPGTGTVTFQGSSGTQLLTGNTTFFNLTLNNAGATTNFGSTTTTVSNDLVASAGTMDGGTSTVVFTGVTDNAGSISGAAAKNFHNLQINSPATISHTAGANITIEGNYINGGTFTQGAGLTTIFGLDNVADGAHTLSGAGTTTFGNFTINGSNAVDAGSHDFNVVGAAFTSAGTFTGNTGTVTFNGGVAQAITGDGVKNFGGLLVNNVNGVSVLNGALPVDASVLGILTLNTDLTVAAGAILQQSGTSAGAGDAIGTVRRTDLGMAARAFGNPFNTIAIDMGTAPTQMDVTLVKMAPPDFTTAVTRTYTITPTGGSGISATQKLHYRDSELNGNMETKLAQWRKTGTWVALGRTGAVDTVNNVVTLSGISQFSDWTLAQVEPPTISKAFGAASIPLNGTTTLTFTITNPNTTTGLTGAGFTDTLMSGLKVADTPNVMTNNCGGSVDTSSLTANATALAVSNAAVGIGTPCTISVNVKGTTAGTVNNTTSAATSTEGGAGDPSATVSLNVIAPPAISKAFGASSIVLNTGTTTMTFTITNPNSSGTLTGVGFDDTLQSGLQVADTPNVTTNNCGGGLNTSSFTAGATALSVSGAAVAVGSPCTISVNVKGTAAGTVNNTTSAITSTEGGTGNASNTASLNVFAPPTIAKAFGASTIAPNAATTMSFTITNPTDNPGSLTGVGFTDTLTGSLQIANPPNLSNNGNCGSPSTTGFTAGSTSLSVSGVTVATANQCVITVDVTATAPGTVNNTTSAITSTEGGTGNASNTAMLTVASPPTLVKDFGGPQAANLIYALSATNTLARFNANAPGTALGTTTITGLVPGDAVVAIDFRPATGQLYGLGVQGTIGHLYTINTATGAATQVGGNITLGAGATDFGLDFNPVADRIRVAANNRDNFRVDPNTGTAIADTALNPGTPVVVGAAYTNNFAGAAATTLYGIDTSTNPDQLVFQGGNPVPPGASPNGGLLTAVGSLGINTGNNEVGFDIAGDAAGTVYAALQVGGVSGLYTINLTTGAATSVGTFGGGLTARDIAVWSSAQIPVGGTATLNFSISNPNASLALSNISFNDSFPAGLEVDAAPMANNTCGGTFNPIPGDTTVNLSGVTLAGGGSCTLSVKVKGTTAGNKTNTTGAISSTETGAGLQASDNITVVGPPAITKAFSPTSVAVNGISTLTITITNPATNTVALNDIAVSDSFPSDLEVDATPMTNNTCGGTFTANAGATSISLSGGSIATPGNSCQVSVNVKGTTAGAKMNTTGMVSSADGGTGSTASATLNVFTPATVVKSFAPPTVALNGISTMTITITNPAANPGALTGLSFTDMFPAGLEVDATPMANNTCGGTFTASAGATSISLSGGSIATPGNSCQVSVNVKGATTGPKVNNVTVNSTEGGASAQASATLSVGTPPTLSKSFSPAQIKVGETSTLTFNISNPNAVQSLTGIQFTDSLPAGVEVDATPAAVNSGCGGTFTAAAGATSISFSGGTLAASGSCSLSVKVKATTFGLKDNVTGAISATESGPGGMAMATLTVVGAPDFSKSFAPNPIRVGNTSSLSFTITNPNTTVGLTGIAFNDVLPAGLAVSDATLNNVCGTGSTLTVTAATRTIALSGGNLTSSAPDNTCSFSVTVTGTAVGAQVNTTGNITSNESAQGGTATATLNVFAPATVVKSFSPTGVEMGGVSTLTITITNPAANPGALTGLSFTDSFPAGLEVDAAPNAMNTCGGTFTASLGATSISLSGGAIAMAGGSCAVSVDVKGTTTGQKVNNVVVNSTEGGMSLQASATLNVAAAPTLSKSFTPDQIAVGATSTLQFTINNPNAFALSGIGFNDTLPAGVMVASSGPTAACGGSLSTTSPSTISLTGGALGANGSCNFSVTVTGAQAGAWTNTTGNISASESGPGLTASDDITVVAPPDLAKDFTPASIALGTTTTLGFTVTNPAANTVGLSGINFTDTLPVGLSVADSMMSNVCGAGSTLTVTAATRTIALAGGSLGTSPSNTCNFNVTVTGAAAGGYTNTVSSISSTEGGTNDTEVTAMLSVVAPPLIAKAFSPSSISLNGVSTLAITITNPMANTVPLTGVAVTDMFPAGLEVDASPTVMNSCSTGTFNPSAGNTSISISGATIPVGTACTFSVNVKGTAAGTKVNTTGAVMSANGGNGGTASDTLNVALPPALAKQFAPDQIPLGGASTLSFTITNPNSSLVLSNISFTDTLPAGVTVASSMTSTCGGTLQTAAPSTISFTGGTLAMSANCMFNVTVTGAQAGTWTNMTGTISSNESGPGLTASDDITVVAPPDLAKAFAPMSITLGTTTMLGFTITNPAANTVGQSEINFTDTLPIGLTVADATINDVCGTGSTLTVTAATRTIALAGGSLAVGGSCNFNVTVTGAAAGAYTNTVSSISSTEGGTNNTPATSMLTVVAPPLIAKAFSPTNVPVNGISTLAITVTNPAANTVALTGVAVTDMFPAGLEVDASPMVMNSCSTGTFNPSAGNTSISISGAAIPVGTACTFSVNVKGTTSGPKMNTTGAVMSANGGNGLTASATLTVASPPTVSKSFSPVQIPIGGTSTLTFTVVNPNAAIALSGINFIDTLPAGVTVANGSTSACGGTLQTTAPNTISFTGGMLAANTNCIFNVTVTGAQAGDWNNTTGTISSTESGPGATSNTAQITIVAPPNLAKSFIPSQIALNTTSTLRLIITTPAANTVGLTGIAFTDVLPAGIAVADGMTAVCGGTLQTTAATRTVSFTGGTLGVNTSCTTDITVTGTTAGDHLNTVNSISSTEGGTNSTPVSATLTIVAPPVIAKSFSPDPIQLNGVTTLTVTITNPSANTVALTGIAFTDPLTGGLEVDATPMITNTCNGTVAGATSGSTSLSLSNGSIAMPGASCTIAVRIKGTQSGAQNNQTSNVTSNNGGTGNQASATLTVNDPPVITPVAVTREQGSPAANSQIATASDTEDAEETLTVMVNGGAMATVNGVTVSNLSINAAGVVTADVVASCTATTAIFTLVVTDSLGATDSETLTVTVTPNTPPVLGAYPATAVGFGGSFVLPPSAVPSDNGSIASVVAGIAPATFTGTVAVDPLTGVVTVTNAAPAGNYTVTVTATDNCGAMSTSAFTLTVNPLAGSVDDPFACTGPGDAIVVTLTTTNLSAIPLPATTTAALPPQLLALAGTCTANVGSCTVVDSATVSWSGTLAPGQTVTINYQVQVADGVAPGTELCITSTAEFNGGPPATVAACATVDCPAAGPGLPLGSFTTVSADRAGSVLIYNFYTSSATTPARENTRFNLTNTDPTRQVGIHLFFVDGSSCSVADRFICLTPNQTFSFLASDIDPGTSGYLVAVAVDLVTGCPINFNHLIGDAYVKMASGHAANLGAEAVPAIAGGLPLCTPGSLTAQLSFDGVSYAMLGRVVASSSIGSPAEGNQTLLVVNRIGGSLQTEAAAIGNIFGVLFDDGEGAHSFTFAASACQFRSHLNNSFPRTSPPFDALIPAGHTGWMKFWLAEDGALTGAVINFNAAVETSGSAFNQGRNLHKVTLTQAASVTIPVFPPGC